MSIIHLTKATYDDEVLNSEKPVLIDFFADWCGPCKMLAPIIENIAKTRTDIKVCKVNVDEEQDLATAFDVASIPTIVVVKNGKVTEKTVGYCSQETIEELL
ncbi:MAG: thioredoxin [Clostridia bacterium]